MLILNCKLNTSGGALLTHLSVGKTANWVNKSTRIQSKQFNNIKLIANTVLTIIDLHSKISFLETRCILHHVSGNFRIISEKLFWLFPADGIDCWCNTCSCWMYKHALDKLKDTMRLLIRIDVHDLFAVVLQYLLTVMLIGDQTAPYLCILVLRISFEPVFNCLYLWWIIEDMISFTTHVICLTEG